MAPVRVELRTGSTLPRMEQIVQAIAALVAIANPIGAAPVFASLTAGRTPGQRHKAAIGVVIAVVVILVLAAFAGERLLKAFGISLPAFQAGGGLVVLLMGLEMLHGTPTKMQHGRDRTGHAAGDGAADATAATTMDDDDPGAGNDSIIVPLAMPMIAGPGTITTVITLTSDNRGWEDTMSVLIATGVLGALLLVVLFGATWLDQRMSRGAHTILLRFMGLVLVAIGAQLVLAGVKGFHVTG